MCVRGQEGVGPELAAARTGRRSGARVRARVAGGKGSGWHAARHVDLQTAKKKRRVRAAHTAGSQQKVMKHLHPLSM